MQISDKMVQHIKDLHKEKEGVEISESEAYDAASNLVGFFELLMQVDMRDKKRQQRLKKEPGGFPLESDGYTCLVCRRGMDAKDSWYDWYGQTCLLCRKAVRENIIPPFVCKEYNSYYSMWQLKDKFGITHQTAKKYIREGKLVARIVTKEDGKPYEYIFLKKENLGLVDRPSAVWKSYRRSRDKMNNRLIREERKKLRAEWNEKYNKPKKKKNTSVSGLVL